MKNDNPLLCDPESGICEIPGASKQVTETHFEDIQKTTKPVTIIYYTDPICSSCWGIEPQLRRLKLEYGSIIQIDYRMGGLLPSWDIYNSGGISKPSDVAHHWDEVSAYYEMPIDGDVWLEDPLSSSYPPSIAYKAAEIQDKHKAVIFMRRLRELVFLEKKNITKWEHIEAAAAYAELDTAQLHKDYNGAAILLFNQDLQIARQMGVRGFPTLFFTNSSGEIQRVYGSRPYSEFEKAIKAVYPSAEKQSYPLTLNYLFSIYPSLTPKEAAVLLNISIGDATKQLVQMEKENKLTAVVTKNGNLWRKK